MRDEKWENTHKSLVLLLKYHLVNIFFFTIRKFNWALWKEWV